MFEKFESKTQLNNLQTIQTFEPFKLTRKFEVIYSVYL